MVRPVTIACVLVVSVAASACSPGRAAIVAGAAGMALGAYGLTRPDSQCSGSEAFCTNFADPLINEPINKTRDAASISMLVVGLGLVVVGLATEPSLRDEQKPTPPAPLVSAPSTTFAPPATVRTPVDLALATRIENRLAIQASAIARHGDCPGAIATSKRLAELDPEMHRRLVAADADLARCLAQLAN